MAQQPYLHWGWRPYVIGSDTSKAAADAIDFAILNALERKVYEAFLAAGKRGLTDEECQAATGLEGSTQRPRRVRLVALGLLDSAPMKRRTRAGRLAQVWTVY